MAILLRPTLSRALFRQQVGRVLRPKADGARAVVLDYGGNLFRHGLPDMEPRWSLDGKPKGAPGEPPVKTCQACGAAMALAERVCPACGYCPPVGTIDEDLTGALRQIDEQMIMEAMMAERPYRELLGLARSREHLQLIAAGSAPQSSFSAGRSSGCRSWRKCRAPSASSWFQPLLEQVDLAPWLPEIQWLIVGAESGPDARPFDPDWARSLR